MPLTFGSLFAGIGGFDLGFERAGMVCKWQVEINPYCQKVLHKHWPNVRKYDDVRTFPPTDADEWRVDVICGGFPCQDISNTGHKAGIDGERSGLWKEYARIICDIRPRYVIVENVAALTVRGMDRVLADLALLGFDAEWGMLPACALGAPHTRERMFIVANSEGSGRFSPSDSVSGGSQENSGEAKETQAESPGRCPGDGGRNWWSSEPTVARVVDGVSSDVDGPNRAIGNSVSPIAAEWIARRLIKAAA